MKEKPFIKNKKLNWQGLISLLVLLSFLIMLFSGIVLYIAPEGSFSRWTGWTVLGLSKSDWELQHTIFSYVFSLVALVHIFVYNIIPLISYFRKKPKIGFPLELIIAVVFIAGIFWLTQNDTQPFRFIDKWGGEISDHWETNDNRPPFPEAEEMKLNEIFAKYPELKVQGIKDKLEEQGIRIESKEQTILEIAEQNKATPLLIYQKIEDVLEEIGKEQSE